MGGGRMKLTNLVSQNISGLSATRIALRFNVCSSSAEIRLILLMTPEQEMDNIDSELQDQENAMMELKGNIAENKEAGEAPPG